MSDPQPKTSGVYAIYSAVNDRWYIGSAVNFRNRWDLHRYELRKGVHGNDHLQKAWNKHGPGAFEFSIVEECSQDQLLIREQYYLDLNFLNPDPYNICRIAGSAHGYKHTSEAKAKISAARKGRKATPEARANMSAAKIGNTYRVGHVASPEANAKNSAAQKGNTYRVGHKASPEARANMSAGQTGRKHSPETKARMSAAQKTRYARKREEEVRT